MRKRAHKCTHTHTRTHACTHTRTHGTTQLVFSPGDEPEPSHFWVHPTLGPIPSSWGANSLLPPPSTSAHCSQSHLYKVITRFTGQLTPQHTLWLTLAPEGTPRPPNPQGPRPPALWVMAPKPAPASSRQAPPAALMCLDLSILCLPHTSVLLLFSLKTLVFWPHCVTCGTSVP